MPKKPKFQRQDFEFIAKVISEIADESIRATTCLRFADNLQDTNPNFKWDTFVKACGCEAAYVQVAKALEEPVKPVDIIEVYHLDEIKPSRVWTGQELVKEYRKRFGK